MNRNRHLSLGGGLAALMLAALACTCGRLGQVGGLQATVGAAEETSAAAATQLAEAVPTLAAGATQYAPTLDAQMTEVVLTADAAVTQFGESLPTFIAGATGYAPTLTAQMTEIVLTVDAAARGGTPAGTPGGQGTVFDGGDGHATLQILPIALNQPQTARLDDLGGAHNWLFEGTAGQQVTIRVEAIGDANPRVRLIDPGGGVIGEDDDSGGGPGGHDALLAATLPVSGTYTVRVDVLAPGEYRITVE